MAFGNNSTLVTTASQLDIANNGTNDVIPNDATDNQATAFNFTNGNTGDDSIENFGRNDSILNYQKIFDGNNDGIIDFGPNGILDIDRTSRKNPGSDQITLQGFESKALRYLGTKEGGNQHVYADAATRLDLANVYGFSGVVEGTVANNSFNAGDAAHTYLYDTALGLNLGGDTITNFGNDDLLVTTSAIRNGADAGIKITYGGNGVLDLSGEEVLASGQLGTDHGGQIDLVGTSGLYLVNTIDTGTGVTYYVYGLQPAPTEVSVLS